MRHPLYVVTCISNPVQYKRRYELYREFRKRMELEENVILVTVEMAFGERDFEITSEECPWDIQIRGNTELWQKENLLNIGFRSLPDDWKYAAWIDADIMFTRPDWARATIDKLQHYDVVQMFSEVYDLNPQYELAGGVSHGYVYNWAARDRTHYAKAEKSYTSVGSPGYAWAFTREAFDTLGGLLQSIPLGSADYYMADAMCNGQVTELRDTMHPGYLDYVEQWRQKALLFQENIGWVAGSLVHFWHGRRANRGYGWRIDLLSEHQFDPNTDVHFREDGLMVLNRNKPKFRDALRHYFRSRGEDDLYTDKIMLIP